MALAPGTRLGVYEVTALLGEGGMGQVYRATDTTLGRQVAIKILPDAFAADPERLARFEREAKTLASLNHPHIAAIYAVEKSAGVHALVMELVEGEDLSTLIAGSGLGARGSGQAGASSLETQPPQASSPKPRALDLADALPIAKQIAEALEAAHEQGIIHRDLKPANIKVRADGTVKVLDFGLAKALDPAQGSGLTAHGGISNSPTITSPAMTQAGMILGTAAYMSPEQAKGRVVDKRSDVWAFGAVLFEMLSGRRAFEGEDVSETLARILMKEPDWTALPPTVPPSVVNVLRRCLEKDRKRRVRDIGDVSLALEGAFDAPGASVTMVPPAPAARGRVAWAAAALAAALLAVLAVIHFREVPPVTPLRQTEMPLPDGVGPGYPVLSPDGTRLVVRGTPAGGRPQLYLRSLAGRAFAPIPGSENAGLLPFWSPDSQWIAFGTGGKLVKWNVTGGQPPQVVCNANADSGSWSDEGVILFSEEGKPIQRVSEAGGTPRNALEFDSAFGEQGQNTPYFLPGGKAFLFGSNGTVRGAHFFATLDGKVRRRLPDNLNGPNRWVATPSAGALLAYTSRNQLFVRPFDSASGEFSGEAVLLVDEVVNGPTPSFGGTSDMVYMPTRTAPTRLRWYGGDGKTGETLGEPGNLISPQVSPDGKQVVFSRRDSGKNEIWVIPAGGGVGERIASVTGNAANFNLTPAIWTPDRRVLYTRRDDQDAEVIERPADALGSDSVVVRIPGNTLPVVRSISANGKVIALSTGGGGKSEVSLLSRPGGTIRPANLPPLTSTVALSPDGKWLAYRADLNAAEVFVRAVPEDPNAPLPPGERQIASIPTPVQQLRWSDDNQLLILAGPAPEQRVLMALPIVWTDGTPRPGALRKLFDAPKAVSFDVTDDGRRFIVAETVGENVTPPMVLVQNWPALLRQ